MTRGRTQSRSTTLERRQLVTRDLARSLTRADRDYLQLPVDLGRIWQHDDLDRVGLSDVSAVDEHDHTPLEGPGGTTDRTGGDRRVREMGSRPEPTRYGEPLTNRETALAFEGLDAPVVRVPPRSDITIPEELGVHDCQNWARPPRTAPPWRPCDYVRTRSPLDAIIECYLDEVDRELADLVSRCL